MKVTGETSSFIEKREKRPRKQDTKSIKTFRQKDYYRTELWNGKRGTHFSFYLALNAGIEKKNATLLPFF